MKRRRIAITGVTGRVGAALAAALAGHHDVIPLPREELDLAEPGEISGKLGQLGEIDVFLNPAGITSLEACEDDSRAAMTVNAKTPGKIAEWCADRGVRMIHFSTDYVFGGLDSEPVPEAAPPQPLSAYGRSKRAGELAVMAFSGHTILRVSWVFGPEKPSFVDSVMRSVLAGEPVSAVADKTSLPTFTGDLCGWVAALLEQDFSGVLHACNPGAPVSWHGLATAVVEEMHAAGALPKVPMIGKSTLAGNLAFRAVRPAASAMDSSRLSAVIGNPLRSWSAALAQYVRERCQEIVPTQCRTTRAVTGK